MSDPAAAGEGPRSGLEAEGAGETVGEAKWTGLRELERRVPGLDKTTVEFVVLSEGERGLLGVGFAPARVLARTTAAAAPPAAEQTPRPPGSPAAGELAELLERIRDALSVEAAIEVREAGGTLTGTFRGRDLGLVIGKHGQTIDAIQQLASAALSRSAGERLDVVVDAAGYRERRRSTLEGIAERAAARARSTGLPVELEPMSSAERKVVHLRLRDVPDVVTSSEGAEPSRFVVVRLAE
ncbi:MAG: KH domain-containing protein [Thermoleophilia bacterium]|nr:KH domain-containing protein [Thermoleophilia bacterium]